LPPRGNFVYKFEFAYNGANDAENHNMSYWRRQGFKWAPETWLLTIDGVTTLAMSYFPGVISSMDDVPSEILDHAPDRDLSNFRRSWDGTVMLIDAGEWIPGIP
jgi:hypothetical protein